MGLMQYGITVKVISSLATHPCGVVTRNEYVVVTAGFALGFSKAAFVKAVEGDHRYVPAEPLACMVYTSPAMMVASGPALAVAPGKIVTVIVRWVEQVPRRASSVYVVVVDGLNTGEAMDALLTPVPGVQLKLVAVDVTAGVNEAPKQILVPLIGSSVNVFVNEMVAVPVAVQVVTGLRVTTVYVPPDNPVKMFDGCQLVPPLMLYS